MTEMGTFIINGGERIIVSQLVRSPGVYFNDKVDKNGKVGYGSTVIPNRGAWLELESDSKDIAYTRIDLSLIHISQPLPSWQKQSEKQMIMLKRKPLTWCMSCQL